MAAERDMSNASQTLEGQHMFDNYVRCAPPPPNLKVSLPFRANANFYIGETNV